MKNSSDVVVGLQAMLTVFATDLLDDHQKARIIGGLLNSLPPQAVSPGLIIVMRELMIEHVKEYRDKNLPRATTSEGEGSGVRPEPRVVQGAGKPKAKKKAG